MPHGEEVEGDGEKERVEGVAYRDLLKVFSGKTRDEDLLKLVA